jgi:hypothetical protein
MDFFEIWYWGLNMKTWQDPDLVKIRLMYRSFSMMTEINFVVASYIKPSKMHSPQVKWYQAVSLSVHLHVTAQFPLGRFQRNLRFGDCSGILLRKP